MRSPNYHQERRRKEQSRKARQQEKQQRRGRLKQGGDGQEAEPLKKGPEDPGPHA
jgi:hypothetical protein